MSWQAAWAQIGITFCFLFSASAQPDLVGSYQGKWEGMTASGDFELTLQQQDGSWKAKVTFSIGETAVATTVSELKVDGGDLEITYVFELGGVKLQSRLKGSFRNGEFSGKYRTQTLAEGSLVDEGSCTAKRTTA
ncbi:MAG: hypothetical protein NZV14_17840 [Bryobacteraceae bacterium]|nr:hypothetical protein [Bryobacteraceae bacterium]MDW8380026.1 hypothetical protein [Bryobacterales bacterium]